MWPDRVSKPGPLALEAEVLLTAARDMFIRCRKIVQQGLTALAVGADWVCFGLVYSRLSSRFWKTAEYRLQY